MDLIASYRNSGFEAVADGAISFFDRRIDLHRKGIAFSSNPNSIEDQPAKVSTDISLVGIDRSDPEAFALSNVIIKGVTAALNKYLQDRPLIKECVPEKSLFVIPIFNIQRYEPGEGFKRWHCDWTFNEEEDATEPLKRVLAWILYCNDIDSAGTEFYWQKHHESADRGKLIIFPASPSHIHRGRVSYKNTKTIVTGWINAGTKESYISHLASS